MCGTSPPFTLSTVTESFLNISSYPFVGSIIYWGLIRFALVLVGAWILYAYVPQYSDWWTLFFVSISVVVIYPAQLAWRKHLAEVRQAARNGLCATCRYYLADETLCSKLDEHVQAEYTPCGGEGWDPLPINLN